MKETRNMWIAIAIGLILLVALILFGTSSALLTVNYKVLTDKVTKPVRLALVTDLHSCAYGKGQQELILAIKAQSPDAVLLGGDIFDDDMPHENAKTFVKEISSLYPCYYVTGNHEVWSGEEEALKQFVNDCGADVLENECAVLSTNGQMINICGLSDPAGQTRGEKTRGDINAALGDIDIDADHSRFTVLLTHRPELINEYLNYDFDLILAGHAHGGQWRLPGLINGLLAPNQGLFPKYAGGRYDFKGKTMLVSRGLARESTKIPRIFNRPELVIIDIEAN